MLIPERSDSPAAEQRQKGGQTITVEKKKRHVRRAIPIVF